MEQLTPPRVLLIYLHTLTPLDPWGVAPFPDQPWKFIAEFTVEPQLHSDMRTPRPGIYNAMDVTMGDFITTQAGKCLEVTQVLSQSVTSVRCRVQDRDRLNSSVDQNQVGESAIQLGSGLLFTAPEGEPLLYPLPENLGQITPQDLVQIVTRFATIATPGPSGSTTISSLLDVDSLNADDGHILVYEKNTALWTATGTLSKQIVEGGTY